MSVDVPLAPADAWAHVSNLSELGDWLSMHEGWRGDPPTELTVGTELVGVASVKGLRNRVTWKVIESNPPHKLALTGNGKGGTKLGLSMAVSPKGTGSEVALVIELGGRPLFGPIGSGVARAVRGDIEKSLDKFVQLYS